MNDDQKNGALRSILAFSMGAVVGAGVALLVTPRSGAETRKLVRGYATNAVDELAACSQDAQAAVKTALEPGREAVEATKEYGKHAYETGKEAVKELGKEMKTHA
jgi:gas vesicle protein